MCLDVELKMQSKTKHCCLILLAIAAFSACTTKPELKKIVHYQCERGSAFSVTFIEKGVTTVRGGRNSMPRYAVKKVAANVTLADGTLVTLPAQKVSSGFMYSNGQYTLRGNDDQAMWSVGKLLAELCEIKP